MASSTNSPLTNMLSRSRLTPPPAPLLGTIPLPPEWSSPTQLLAAAGKPIPCNFLLSTTPITPLHALFERAKSTPAVYPPLASLIIFSEQLNIEISVSPTSNTWVSVLDVLTEIHSFLHRTLDEDTLSGEQRTAEGQPSEFREGRKLVDLLQGCHMFAGLSKMEGSNILELHLSYGQQNDE